VIFVRPIGVPIEGPDERPVLRADYRLQDFSQRLSMYCLSARPAGLDLEVGGGLSVSDPVSGQYCFEHPESVRRK